MTSSRSDDHGRGHSVLAVVIAALWLSICIAALPQSPAPAGAPQAPVTWLIFVDDLHLDFRNTGRIRNLIRTITKELIHEGDSFAIASSGRSSLAVDLTSDRRVLDPAIRAVTGNGLRFEDVIQAPGSGEVLYRASLAATTARSLLARLPAAPPAPTALIYISNGYSFEVLPEPPPGGRRFGPGRDFTRAEVRTQFTELTMTARSASVRIFTIGRSWPDDVTANPADPVWLAHQAESQRTLRAIAAEGDGFAILDRDWATQLKRVADAMRK